MSKHKSAGKTLIIADDDDVTVEELNPFSFKEFIRCHKETNVPHQKDGCRSTLELCKAEPSYWSFHPEAEEEEEEEEEEGSYRPVAVEEEQSLGAVGSTSSLCSEEEEESSSCLWLHDEAEEEEERTRFSSEGLPDRGGAENYEGDDETSMAEPCASLKGRRARGTQLQQLKEENLSLKRALRELQKKNHNNELRVHQLSEELVQRRLKEEKEAQALESMVQSVEQNLHLMTKRALKAESVTSKLKLDLRQLQEQCEAYRAEREQLKAAESDSISTMRQNAKMAAEQLNQTVSSAHNCIRQLLSGADNLTLVSQLLHSIDKISTVPPTKH